MLWFLPGSLLLQQGKNSEKICFNCFFSPSKKNSLLSSWNHSLFMVLWSLLFLSKEKPGILGFEIHFSYNLKMHISENIQRGNTNSTPRAAPSLLPGWRGGNAQCGGEQGLQSGGGGHLRAWLWDALGSPRHQVLDTNFRRSWCSLAFRWVKNTRCNPQTWHLTWRVGRSNRKKKRKSIAPRVDIYELP